MTNTTSETGRSRRSLTEEKRTICYHGSLGPCSRVESATVWSLLRESSVGVYVHLYTLGVAVSIVHQYQFRSLKRQRRK